MLGNTKSELLPLQNGMAIIPVPPLFYRLNEEMPIEIITVAVSY